MKLMYAPLSPFVRKVRAVSIELGLAERIELVMTAVAPGQPNEAYARDFAPLRKVPALVLDDASVLYDSTVICEYLDGLAGGKLSPAEGAERWRALTQQSLANGICEAAVLVRYETALRPEELRWQTWIDDQLDKVGNGLDWFEDHDDTRAGPLNIAQLALGCALGYLDFRFESYDWRARCPGLKAWYAELAQRPSFTETRPDA